MAPDTLSGKEGGTSPGTERVPPGPDLVWYSNRWRTKDEAAAIKAKQVAAAEATNAKRASGLLVEAPKPLSGEEQDGLRQATYREVVEWTWDHLEDSECPVGATSRAKALWAWASQNKSEFLGKYLPMLVKAEKPEDKLQDEGGEVNLKLLEDMIAEFRERCPHCGGGP